MKHEQNKYPFRSDFQSSKISIQRQQLKNRFLSYFAYILHISKARNLMWFVFARSTLFSKKMRKSILGFGRSKSEEINLENQYSTINLHHAGKLKHREKDRHFLSTEQVFFIYQTVVKQQQRNLLNTSKLFQKKKNMF